MSQESVQRGATVFSNICAACHQPHGRGMKGSIPPLDGSEWLNAKVKGIPVSILLKGLEGPITVKGEKFDNVMPSKATLSDQQIADVLTYARKQWSNNSSPITAEYVTQVRASLVNRKKPWTSQELKSMVGGKIEKEEQNSSPFSYKAPTTLEVVNKADALQASTIAQMTPQVPQSESSFLFIAVVMIGLMKHIHRERHK